MYRKQRRGLSNSIVIAILAVIVIGGGIIGYRYLSTPSNQTPLTLTGSGATFPYPLLDTMIKEYQTQKTNVLINYQSIGSGGGIAALEGKTVDFAASDAPLGASDREKAPGALHIPETIGAVTIAYNIPDIPTGLHLTGKVIAEIFAGNVTTWNDPAINALNPDVSLPDKDILVVHRSDGSGTTYIFTGYLSLVSDAWEKTIGQGKTVAWPIGIGSNGNTGVASVVQGTQYTIGYVELAYALQNDMTVAAVQNPAGGWVLPTLDTIKMAVQSAASRGLPMGSEDWSNVNLLNAPDQQAYPIVSFTYLLVYQELNVIPGMTQDKATELVQFLWWVVHDGQQYAPDLVYAQLPDNVVQLDEDSISSITFNGQHLQTS